MAKTVLALIFTLIISASIPSPVFAAAARGFRGSKPTPVTLGGLSLSSTIGGYSFSGPEQRTATQSYGLKVGYEILGRSFADSLGIEGSLNYFTTRSKADAGNSSCYLFRLDAIYPFIVREKWMPFLAVGAGEIVIDSASNADKSLLFNYGAGLKYFLEDYLAVRVDVRRLLVYDKVSIRNNFEVGIGMSYYFGKERKKKPVPPPAKQKEKGKEDAKTGKKTDETAISKSSAVPALDDITKPAGEKAGEEKKPAMVTAPDAATAESAKPKTAEALPSISAEAASAPVAAEAGAAALPKAASTPTPTEAGKSLQLAAPAAAPTTQAPVEAIPPVPVAAITAPTATEATAPVNIESAPTPAEGKITARATAPDVATASPTPIEAVPPVPVAVIPAPATIEEAAPLKIDSVSTTDGVKKSAMLATPDVAPAPLATVEAAQTASAAAIPAPIAAEAAAPVMAESTPTPDGVKKSVQLAAPEVAPAPLATPTIVEAVPPATVAAIPAPITAEAAAPVKPESAPEPALPLTLSTEKTQPSTAESDEQMHTTVRKKVVRKLTIEFDINSSYIKPKYRKKLRKIANIMKNSSYASARIEGHADSIGKLSYNMKLSKQRARSVRKSLKKLGVNTGRISTLGYGPSRPIASNATAKGRSKNRRAVTIVTIKKLEPTAEMKDEQSRDSGPVSK